MCVTRLVHVCETMCVCNVTHSYVWHDSFVGWNRQGSGIFLVGVWLISRCVFGYDCSIRLTLHTDTYTQTHIQTHMNTHTHTHTNTHTHTHTHTHTYTHTHTHTHTHTYAHTYTYRQGSGNRWHLRSRYAAHSCVWHDSFKCVAWLMYMCAMTHSYICADAWICVCQWLHLRGRYSPFPRRPDLK